jgi:hypothetical protein
MIRPLPSKRVEYDAATAFLEGYMLGRPLQELKAALPAELEANGKPEAASVVRSFFDRRDRPHLRLLRN